MKVIEKVNGLPVKIKKQLKTILILVCAVVTFTVPIFGGGYSVLKNTPLVSSAAAIEDVDLLLVAASAFGEARKVMNATDLDAKDNFIRNTSAIVTASKWQNIGLIVGARDALSGSTWSTYQSPITLSGTEVSTYGNSNLTDAYNKYKAFGYAVQNMNNKAKKSSTAAVSMEEGLDSMSAASIKLGSFGVKFLNDYNPAPVLLALYDSSYLGRYSTNKLVMIVTQNPVLKDIICLFGDTVPGLRISFFLLINAIIAVVLFALSMFLTLMGNRTIGDNVKHFLVRIAVGTVGIYLISNVLSIGLNWVNNSVMTVNSSPSASYVEENLNIYDWYLTGFQLPSNVRLQIDASGNFVFTPQIVRSINEYTYRRLVGTPSDEAIQERMQSYVQNGNEGIASFITPSMTSSGGDTEAWATDVYYAIMNNYAQNKDSLLDGNDDASSPLYGKTNFSVYLCRYMWMSSLNMDHDNGTWFVSGNGVDSYYGLNPISAFNLVRSDFSGNAITSTSTVYPAIAYVAFDVVNVYDTSASTNMNAITRFIACFTLVLAAFKGLVTIFTAAFSGLLAGGVKTAFGSSHGLGQALGAVITLIFGVIGISVIMSMTLALLDTIYGIARDIVGDVAVLDAFLQPIQEAVGNIPAIGKLLMSACRGIAEMIMTLVLALTFPKLGGIPITIFAQFMADLPGRIAERAQMIEGMLMSGRASGGGGLPPGRHGQGQYGRQAQGMAEKAFAGGTRQAGSVLKAGAMGAGALAGASLSTIGKAMNKKADNIEGKPKNPGVSNWDDMSPEQQAKAAEAASATDNWSDMDEDTRQKILNDAGVYDDNSAQGGSSSDDTVNDSVNDMSADEVSDESVSDTGNDDTVNDSTIDDTGAAISDVDSSMSMNSGETSGSDTSQNSDAPQISDASGTYGQSVSDSTSTNEVSGGNVLASNEQHIEGSNTTNTGGSSTGGSTTNIEGGHTHNGNQKIDTNVEQKNNMNSLSVDENKQLGNNETNELGIGSTDNKNSNIGVPGNAGSLGASGLNSTDTKDAKGMNVPSSGSISKTGKSGSAVSTSTGNKLSNGSGSTSQSGASANYRSVNNANQTGDNNNMNINAQNNQNTQFGSGVDQSRTMNTAQSMTQTSSESQVNQSLDGNTDRQAKINADNGASSQSMNGTSTSKWGKDMTIKEQKQARAMHAVGDALQMMGGNRTMKDGVKDALGYTAEALVTTVTPPEMMNSFAQDIRNRRQLRTELARRDRQNNNKKK